ncbi:MAG: divisome protein SepX/GlpR [Micromonosporaceae bacterium]
MPTSVLLAVLVAAGLLALAPALVRRYDATERWDAERASSTARILARRRRRRTVPGRAPVNPPGRTTGAAADQPAPGTATHAAVSSVKVDAGRRSTGAEPERRDPPGRPHPPQPRPRPASPRVPRPRDPMELRRWWQRRRRRILGTLVLVVVVEAVAATVVGPGFLVGLTLGFVLLVWYVTVLRRTVVYGHRRRLRDHMIARERAAMAATERRRLAEKRRRMAEARRHAQELARQRAEESSRRAPSEADRRTVEGEPGVPGLRGQSYESRAANF